MFVFCRVLLTWHRLLHLTLSFLRKWSLWKWRKQALLRNNQQQRKENSFFQINHFLAVGNRSSRESDKELSQRIMKNNYEVKIYNFYCGLHLLKGWCMWGCPKTLTQNILMVKYLPLHRHQNCRGTIRRKRYPSFLTNKQQDFCHWWRWKEWQFSSMET